MQTEKQQKVSEAEARRRLEVALEVTQPSADLLNRVSDFLEQEYVRRQAA